MKPEVWSVKKPMLSSYFLSLYTLSVKVSLGFEVQRVLKIIKNIPSLPFLLIVVEDISHGSGRRYFSAFTGWKALRFCHAIWSQIDTFTDILSSLIYWYWWWYQSDKLLYDISLFFQWIKHHRHCLYFAFYSAQMDVMFEID